MTQSRCKLKFNREKRQNLIIDISVLLRITLQFKVAYNLRFADEMIFVELEELESQEDISEISAIIGLELNITKYKTYEVLETRHIEIKIENI